MGHTRFARRETPPATMCRAANAPTHTLVARPDFFALVHNRTARKRPFLYF
jgi:hypothetical protein